MKIQLVSWWERLRESYWAVPATMAIGACLLAHGAIEADRYFQETDPDLPEWMYRGGAEGARVLLSTIVNSMMAVTGVVFSIAVVVLTLASNQFGPHLLRNFIRDRGNQFTLGTFIATFVYALLVLRTIYEQEDTLFVPSTGITLALVLTLFSTAVLIYFIHHISTKIQAEEVIADVDRELNRMLDRNPGTANSGNAELPEDFDSNSAPVTSKQDNYIELIDTDAAMEIATDSDVVIYFKERPGKYVACGEALADVWPGEKLDEELSDRILATCIFGSRRTPQQDLEYGILQLVEIAVRALSPGKKDPFTAIACIDRLASVMRRLAERPEESSTHCDAEGRLRVVVTTSDFEGHLGAAFDQLRQNAESSVAVLARIMEALDVVAAKAGTPERKNAVRKQALMVLRAAEREVPEEADVDSVRARYRRVLEHLDSKS